MSKVICDVCGTAYPETSVQCPICGCAKASTAQTAAADATQRSADTAGGYTYVKGGRFSKKNVRKRNKANGRAPERRAVPDRTPPEKEEKTSVALIVVVVLLLLAIVAVVVYIAFHFFGDDLGTNPSGPSTSQTTPNQNQQNPDATDPTDNTQPSLPADDPILCEKVEISSKTLEFLSASESWTLKVELTPVDTTEKVQFASSDESVVKVSQDGVLTPVARGEAVITITCGAATNECRVVCNFGEAGGTDKPVDKTFNFTFNTKYVDAQTGNGDTSLLKAGDTWRAYKSDMEYDPADIIWASDDTKVCTIDNGIVTAVGPGTTMIHAQYNGITYSCIIRCNFKAETTPDTPADTPSSGETTGTFNFVFDGYKDSNEVTMKIGETWNAFAGNTEYDPTAITWTSDNTAVCTIKNGVVTAVGAGKTEVHATYNGVTRTGIIQVVSQ